MRDQKQHINYSLADIEQYLQGKLSPAEMHELEKAALQDPFLADAIEGYQSGNFTIAKQDLADIHDQLSTGPAKIIPSLAKQTAKWQIAAGLIIVLGIAAFAAQVFLKGNQTKTELALEATAPPKKEDTTARVQVPIKKVTESEKVLAITVKPVAASRNNTIEPAVVAMAPPPYQPSTVTMPAIKSNTTTDSSVVSQSPTANTYPGQSPLLAKETAKDLFINNIKARELPLTSKNSILNAPAAVTIPEQLATIKNPTITSVGELRGITSITSLIPTNRTITTGGLKIIHASSSTANDLLVASPPVLIDNVVMLKDVEGKFYPFRLNGINVKPVDPASKKIFGTFTLDTLSPVIGWVAYQEYLRRKIFTDRY